MFIQSSLPKTKNFLKAKINFLLLFLVSFFNASAQNPELNEVNLQLIAYFEPLSKPSPAKAFLYDMCAHNADSSWFVQNSADTNHSYLVPSI